MSEEQLVRGKLVFVMGGGKFGTNALRYLKDKGAKVLVVDINPCCKASSEVTVFGADLSVSDSLKDGQAAFLLGDAVNLFAVLVEQELKGLRVAAEELFDLVDVFVVGGVPHSRSWGGGSRDPARCG